MKKGLNRNARIVFTAAFLLNLFISTGCKKDDVPVDHDYTLSGSASGAQEVPAAVNSATGTITGNYNDETNILTYTITWNGLSGNVTGSHFHGPALPGVSAGVILPITLSGSGPSGTVTGTATLTDAQETDFLAGKWYYNLHTAAKPGGEIRGQVTATK